jgi:hypothetical protein
MLWRPDATQTASLTFAGAGAASQKVQWPAGEATLPWPNGVPVVAGSEYRVSWDGKPQPTKLTFTTLTTQPTTTQAVAESLIENKCDNQLEALIETVPPDSPAS